jgi:hypothetical protein
MLFFSTLISLRITSLSAQKLELSLELKVPPSLWSFLTVANQTVNFENDYLIREMAIKLGIQQGFGPVPSIEMLLQELAKRAQEVRALLPMKDPAPGPSSIF